MLTVLVISTPIAVALLSVTPQGVLVRAQYSTTIGGKNEPIKGVIINYRSDSSSGTATTDDYGHCYIQLLPGLTYTFDVTYKERTKTFYVKYMGESVLFIHIDPTKGEIVGMDFLTPQPITTQTTTSQTAATQVNTVLAMVGIMVAIFLVLLAIRKR
jgi:hypothetical protein